MEYKLDTRLDIKVLGSGCFKCNSLEKVTRQAIEELNNGNAESFDNTENLFASWED